MSDCTDEEKTWVAKSTISKILPFDTTLTARLFPGNLKTAFNFIFKCRFKPKV